MAVHNLYQTTTIQAGEDLSGSQYAAIALNDGKVAANGEEASGILINKPQNKEHAEVAWQGECKYKAGGAITKGGKITVSTSGFFTAGDSGDYIVGEAKSTVTSGSLGVGFFSFPTAAYLSV